LSAAAYSLGHGGNDGPENNGDFIAGLLFSAGILQKFDSPGDIPLWVFSFLSHSNSTGLQCSADGELVKTMGQKVVKLRPV